MLFKLIEICTKDGDSDDGVIVYLVYGFKHNMWSLKKDKNEKNHDQVLNDTTHYAISKKISFTAASHTNNENWTL